MGFFTDLKADLSQAVNELVEEEVVEVEEVEEVVGEVEEVEEVEVVEEVKIEEGSVKEEKKDIVEELELFINKEAVKEELQPEPKKEKYLNKKLEEKKMNKEKESLVETAMITKGMSIVGDINTKGSVDILGEIIGNVTALGKLNIAGTIQGNSKASEIYVDSAEITGEIVSDGSIKVGASSVIIGNITATSAVIAGAIKGDIDVKGPVVLDASAIVMGNIKSKSVQINSGAVIEGLCSQCYADISPTSFFSDIKKKKATQ